MTKLMVHPLCKLKWGSSTKKEEKIALKPIKEKSTTKFQPNDKENGHIASQFLESDGRNATLLPLPPNQMEEEQLQIKRPIGKKSKEFKNVFLEQMPLEKSPIMSVVIDSRTNLFEKRGNDVIQLEDPSHGHTKAFQDDGFYLQTADLLPKQLHASSPLLYELSGVALCSAFTGSSPALSYSSSLVTDEQPKPC
ncbi:hypothetical protein CDL15_Pgr011826 [Punica granatum]|uniref:Uncharacterized protein n=1 Tax=Punica granatum TaxID=22663 RepID=A0A218XDX2_PUNGR|nr:hypothetical protein CDL15_Pgr011826 [Punica granatum]